VVHRVPLQNDGAYASSEGLEDLKDSLELLFAVPPEGVPKFVSWVRKLVVVSTQGVRDYAACPQHEPLDNGDQFGVAPFIGHASVCPVEVTCSMSIHTLPLSAPGGSPRARPVEVQPSPRRLLWSHCGRSFNLHRGGSTFRNVFAQVSRHV
jgi:hypothetical protein